MDFNGTLYNHISDQLENFIKFGRNEISMGSYVSF